MALPALSPLPVRRLNRNIVIGSSVVALHVAALWALQSGFLRRAAEVIIPVAILSEVVTPPAPKAEPVVPPPQPSPPVPVQRPVTRKPVPSQAPTPLPLPIPAAETPSSIAVPPSPPAPIAAAQPSPAPVAPPAPPKIQLPSSDAAYLDNPMPAYPPISKRLGEQGKVMVRVLIGADGRPQKAELKASSGFDRLDRSALEYVMRCRYVPGTVDGVAQAMWKDAPVNFVLE